METKRIWVGYYCLRRKLFIGLLHCQMGLQCLSNINIFSEIIFNLLVELRNSKHKVLLNITQILACL
jgi:hypothetical protein